MNRSVYLDNWIYFVDATLFPAYLGFANEVPLFSTAQEDTWPKHGISLFICRRFPSRAQRFDPGALPFPGMRVVPSLPVCACAFVLFLLARRARRALIPWTNGCAIYTAASIAVFFLFCPAGCGGGSTSPSAPQGPQVVTPQGTSTITIMPSATSANGEPLPWQPIQLTLTVN